ncbi:DUF4262 domain-containing protein [Amycolatopsis nigrescens]|uniref:DUF4262 domain-containing protein n=1 Tax=Amycolatopsis nigrescens TaxID=381445 RepID=UPI00035D9BD2|nr:DUF4262 domain-containing protein [Amycolatopsis nigrescens]
MCWACDHPGGNAREYLEQLHDGIARSGWMVLNVEASGKHPPWAYTVGLTALARPELVVTGMPIGGACELLNVVAGHLLHAEPPVPGAQLPFEDLPFVEVVELAEPSAHLLMAVRLYGPEVRGLQLVHADDRGILPWSKDYRDGLGGQPVLGPRGPVPFTGPD